MYGRKAERQDAGGRDMKDAVPAGWPYGAAKRSSKRVKLLNDKQQTDGTAK